MLLKISLIIAILASIGTLAVSELQVKAKYTEYEAKRTELQDKLSASEKATSDKSKKLSAALDELTGVKKDLTKATDDAKTAQEAAQMAEAAKMAAVDAKDKAEAETKKVIAANKGFFDLHKTPEEIKVALEDLRFTKSELETTAAELKVVNMAYIRVKGENDSFSNPYKKGPSLSGVRGTVTAVDPKWKFVVVNVGVNQGVAQNGVMIVSREGKVIGRIKIASVESDQAVGNVLPDSKTKVDVDVLEGDSVVGQ